MAFLDETGLTYFWGKIKNFAQDCANERAKLCLLGYGANQSTDKAYTNKKITLSEMQSVDTSLITVQGTKIVAQKRGNYLISISTAWNTNATNKLIFSGYVANGGSWLGALNAVVSFFQSGSYAPTHSNTQATFLNKGDYIEPVIQSNIAGATCNEFRITIVYVGGEEK